MSQQKPPVEGVKVETVKVTKYIREYCLREDLVVYPAMTNKEQRIANELKAVGMFRDGPTYIKVVE